MRRKVEPEKRPIYTKLKIRTISILTESSYQQFQMQVDKLEPYMVLELVPNILMHTGMCICLTDSNQDRRNVWRTKVPHRYHAEQHRSASHLNSC